MAAEGPPEPLSGARSSGAEVGRRFQTRLTVGLTTANVIGAVTVFVFLVFVLPTPREAAYDVEVLRVNALVFGVVGLVAVPIGIIWGRRLGGPVRTWLAEERRPRPEERALVLRTPLLNLRLTGALWAGAALVFTVLNSLYSARLGAIVGFGVALGGMTTCALVYLLAERIMREVTARALESGVPAEPAGPGVATRIMLAWALGTGIPLVGAALLTLFVLSGANVEPQQLAATVLFLCAIGLAVGLFAMRITARSVADPIESVRGALRAVEAGRLEEEVPVYDGSEVGLLQAGFNRMLEGLRERERLHDLFGRHVGEDVARRALDRGVELGGELRDCAALFVDLRGSTRLAAERPAPEVVELLNRFFGAVVEVVRAHGGWVNKFEGDAALCVFGAPIEQGNAAAAALAAARELQKRLREELPELSAGIGVSAGQAVAGNIGAAERYEYTVIGDPVNEAARLTELSKELGPGLLASEAIVAAAGNPEAARWRLEDEVVLRGRPGPTRLAVPSTA